jgi:hypothetical protein
MHHLTQLYVMAPYLCAHAAPCGQAAAATAMPTFMPGRDSNGGQQQQRGHCSKEQQPRAVPRHGGSGFRAP